MTGRAAEISAEPAKDDVIRSDEEDEVWATLFARVRASTHKSRWHHPLYVDSIAQLAPFASRTPSLPEINAWLRPSGWRARYVTGYVPVLQYRAMLAERTFPLARPLRQKRDIDHSSAPDFAHDLLGHLPMLFDGCYRELLQEWATRAIEAGPTPADQAVSAALGTLIEIKERPEPDAAAIEHSSNALRAAHRIATRQASRCFHFENFFTWTVEFGMLCWDEPQVFGAAALSSPGELDRITSRQTRLSRFGSHIVSRPVDYTCYQPEVFVAGNFDEYFQVMREI